MGGGAAGWHRRHRHHDRWSPAAHPDAAEGRFARSPAFRATATHFARVWIDAVVAPPVPRALLQADPALAGVGLFKVSRHTNYLLPAAEDRAIAALVRLAGGASPTLQP